MAGGITKEDLVDVDIVDAVELVSDGTATFAYKTGVTLVSTASGPQEVNISGFDILVEQDDPLENGDLVVITGSTAADGTYTVNAVVDADTLTVNEAIPNSTGGTVEFRHPPGSLSVGADPAPFSTLTANNLQDLLVEIDTQLTAGAGLPPATCVGQTLHSVDGVTFTVELPVTTDNGWLVNDEGLLIVLG